MGNVNFFTAFCYTWKMIDLPDRGTILTSELHSVADTTTSISIVDIGGQYIAVLKIENNKRYITTHRQPNQPRTWLNLDALYLFLRERFALPITIELDSKLKTKKKQPSKKK